MKLPLNRTTLVVIGFMFIAGYFLWTEHSAHLAMALPYWPWLLLLACPFLHFFLHGGHGHNHGGHDQPQEKPNDNDSQLTDGNQDSRTGGRHD